MTDNKEYVIQIKRVLGASRWMVLRLLTHVEEFPTFMPSVKKCQIISRTRNKVQTSWHVDLNGLPLKWQQEEEFDFKNFTISFNAFEGDLQTFKGKWKLIPKGPRETELQLEVSISIWLPQVGKIIGGALADKVRQNFNGMLDVFEERISVQRYRKIADRKKSDIKGFAVMCHPYNFEHLVRYIKSFRQDLPMPSREFLSKVFEMTPSYASVELKQFRSKTGKTTKGFFIMCPIVPDMLALDLKAVIKKVIEGCKVAEKLGLGIVALGGFTSIAGEMNNKSIRQLVNIPVTTGNTYTVALALQGVRKAAEIMGISMKDAKVTIIGGAGDIGGGCAHILAREVKEITITSRKEKNLADAERSLSYIGGAKIKTNMDNRKAVEDADIIIAAASSPQSIVKSDDFKPGAVICDIGYPKNISHSKTDRKDILIFSGGICSIPDEFDFGFDVGLPSTRTMYGCYSEAIILDLEEKYENFSEGKGNITEEKVNVISALAEKHGFALAPFFWGDKMLSEEDLEELQEGRKRALLKNAR